MKIFSGWAETVLRLAYPPRCLICRAILHREAEAPLCFHCKPRVSPAGLFCPGCEQFYEGRRSCYCDLTALPLKGIFALSWYEDEWRRVLHRLKYDGCRFLARPLGCWLGESLARQAGWPLDLVVPLPIHRQREARRGYNQSHLIAFYTGRTLGIPVLPLLQKKHSTPAQTGLSRRERKINVAGAFTLPELPGECKSGSVLLVDDIYSTGATLKEAASVLGSRGLSVYGAVAAYNPRLY